MTYPTKTRMETIGRALEVGTKQAARETGIARRTIEYWMASPEFAELKSKARDQVAEDMWAGVQVALREVLDGLTQPRTPLRDKAQALGILYDRYALLSGGATARTEARDITGTLSDAELIEAVREAERLIGLGGVAPEAEGTPEG